MNISTHLKEDKRRSQTSRTSEASRARQLYDKERKKLGKLAWKVFSEYVRSHKASFSGYAECYTCLRKINWREMDASHFRHTKRKKGGLRVKVIDYDERNIKPCCVFCNRFLHGNLARYAQRLVEDYGSDILNELHRIYQLGEELNNNQLKEIIQKYGRE